MTDWLMPKIADAMNAYLHLDAESPARLAPLIGKVITVELLPFREPFQCAFTKKGIELHTGAELPAQSRITGTPLQMVSMMLAKENRQQFFSENIQITGDAQVGQQVVHLFDELDIDWEEQLSHVIGDVAAFHIGRTLASLSKKMKATHGNLKQDLNDYLHEEAMWFPTREALEDYFDEIDRLSMQLDRLEARIDHLNKHLLADEGTQ